MGVTHIDDEALKKLNNLLMYKKEQKMHQLSQ